MARQDDVYFILGLISLALSLFFFPIAIYMVPEVWLGWTYHIPDFILRWENFFQGQFDLTDQVASASVFYLLFFMGFFFAIVAYVASKQIKDDAPKMVLTPVPSVSVVKSSTKDTGVQRFLVIKIIVIVLIVILIAGLLQWIMSTLPGT